MRGQKRRERHLWQALPASLDGEIISALFSWQERVFR